MLTRHPHFYIHVKINQRHLTSCESKSKSKEKEFRPAALEARHRLIINTEVWNKDVEQVQKYPIDLRSTYSLAHQLSQITRERNALVHDDRIDSLAGAVRPWREHIAINEDRRIQQKATEENLDFMSAWLDGSPEYKDSVSTKTKLPQRGIARMRTFSQRPSYRQKYVRKPKSLHKFTIPR